MFRSQAIGYGWEGLAAVLRDGTYVVGLEPVVVLVPLGITVERQARDNSRR